MKKELSAAPGVCPPAGPAATRAMGRAGDRLGVLVRESPEPAALPDAEVLREQGEAIRRLDQLLASLKEAGGTAAAQPR
ncbi:MAG: hypothetical protein U0736_17175 [Gemmataceae bacterium]